MAANNPSSEFTKLQIDIIDIQLNTVITCDVPSRHGVSSYSIWNSLEQLQEYQYFQAQ